MQDTMPCPYCGEQCDIDYVDIGVGEIQCGPVCCLACGASQIGPEIADVQGDPKLSDHEKETYWYAPGKPWSPTANTINGVPVDHNTAKNAWRAGLSLDRKPQQEG